MTIDKKKRAPLPAEAFGRLVLALVGVVWAGIGVTALLQPVWLGGTVDLGLADIAAWGGNPEGLDLSLARFEFRAMYGGLALALAVLHFIGVSRARWIVPCLWMALITLIGLAAGRVVALSAGDVPGGFGFLLLAIELACIALGVFAMVRIRAAERQPDAADRGEPASPPETSASDEAEPEG